MSERVRTWTIDCDENRVQSMRKAIASLEPGVVWDLTVTHDARCPSLYHDVLATCTCPRVQLNARKVK